MQKGAEMYFIRFVALVMGLASVVLYSLGWMVARYTMNSPRYGFFPMDGGWREVVGWTERYLEPWMLLVMTLWMVVAVVLAFRCMAGRE